MSLGKAKLLYIVGSPRSGSTLLDKILDQFGGFFSAGELNMVWEHGLLENTLCGCGARFRTCSFWRSVFDSAFGGMNRIDAEAMARIRRRERRFRRAPLSLLPWRWSEP